MYHLSIADVSLQNIVLIGTSPNFGAIDNLLATP